MLGSYITHYTIGVLIFNFNPSHYLNCGTYRAFLLLLWVYQPMLLWFCWFCDVLRYVTLTLRNSYVVELLRVTFTLCYATFCRSTIIVTIRENLGL
jgi:hypothetical protein